VGYNEEEYAVSKVTSINLCNNIRDINQDVNIKVNRGFDSNDALLFANASKYAYKVDLYNKLLTKERESKTPFPFGMAKAYHRKPPNLVSIKKDCEVYIRKQQTKVLNKLIIAAKLIDTWGYDYYSQRHTLLDELLYLQLHSGTPEEIAAKQAEINALQEIFDTRVNEENSVIQDKIDKLELEIIAIQKDIHNNKNKVFLKKTKEVEVEALYWEKYCLFMTTSDYDGNHKTQAEENVTTHLTFIEQPLDITITGCVLTKHYPSWYVAKHTLEKYGHVIYWSTYTQRSAPGLLATTNPYYGNAKLSMSHLSVYTQDSSFINIYYTYHGLPSKYFQEEIYTEPSEDYLITCEMVGINGVSSPIYLTDKDCPSITKEILLDKEFSSVIPIVEDEDNTLSYEECLRHLYINKYNIEDKIKDIGLEIVKTETDIGETNLPLTTYFYSKYFQQGICLTTKEYSSIHYLYEFFNWLPKGSKSEFNEYTKDAYLYENRISIRNKLCETLISYSYIEEETLSEELDVLNRKVGRTGNATLSFETSEPITITYASNNRYVSQSIDFGVTGYTFGIHGSPIKLETNKLIIKVQASLGIVSKLTIHGLYVKTTLNHGYLNKAESDVQWLISTYGTPTKEVTQSKRDVLYNSASNTLGMIIPLWDHKVRTEDFRNSLYDINTIERMMYDSLNLCVTASLTDDQLDPFQTGTNDTWIKRQDRDKFLTSYLSEFTPSTQRNTETEEDYKERTKTFTKFKDDVTVAVNLSANRYIPRKSLDDKVNPQFLASQSRLSKAISERTNTPNNALDVLITNTRQLTLSKNKYI